MMTAQRDLTAVEDAFEGLIDQASRRANARDCKEVAIDFSAITVVKSYMLDRLIRLHLDARQQGACVVLENVNDLVLEVIRFTRLDRMLRIRLDKGCSVVPNSHLTSR